MLASLCPLVIPLYGDIAINSYGLIILSGILFTLWLAQKDSLRKKYIPSQLFTDLVMNNVLAGMIGGKLLHIITEWYEYSTLTDIVTFWRGGFSVLGSVIAVTGYSIYFLHKHALNTRQTLDLIGIYAPLLQAIGRVACASAGCCYGTITNVPWAILYTNPNAHAPLNVPLHPTQLYSALLLLLLFFIIYKVIRHRVQAPGKIFACYLIGVGAERYITDFLRDDRIWMHFLSLHQWIALCIIGVGIILFYGAQRR